MVFEFKSTKEILWNTECGKFTVLAKPDKLFSKFAQDLDNCRKQNQGEIYKPDEETSTIPIDLHSKYYNFKENPQNIPKYYDHPIVFLSYYNSKKLPSLVALVQSPVTNYIESVSLEEAWEFLKPALFVLANNQNDKRHSSKFKTLADLPIPKNIFKSNWTRDPFSRGSYAGCAPGDDPTDLIIGLSKGFGTNIRFAGEHTIFEGAGCAHGAWLSGKREANYVLNELGVLKEESMYIDED